MPITVRYLDGPNAGRTVTFDDGTARVVIGRDPGVSQVVFAGDDRRVGRQHCVLERRGDHWRLNLDGVHRVLVNEQPVEDGHALRGTCTLRISSNGPRVELTVSAAAGPPAPPPPDLEPLPDEPPPAPSPRLARPNTPPPAPPPDLEPPPDVAALPPPRRERIAAAMPKKGSYTAVLHRLDVSVRRNRRFALLALLLALGVGGGAGWMLFGPKPEPPPPPPPEKPKPTMQQVLNGVEPSVYLVVLRDAAGHESPQATAWVVGDALLATNAHVARLYTEKKPDETLLARSTSEPPHDHAILGVEMHPGFAAGKELWIEYVPARQTSGGRWEAMQMIPACDVATLRLAPDATLGPRLTLAPPATLAALAAGEPVGFVGFPMESLAMGGVNATNPTPTTQIGTLTAVTDFFLGKQVAADRQLVQHNLPAAGGASGSPILNGAGQVVAVLSGGNVVLAGGSRIGTGAGVNFAQRVDLLQELLEGRAAPAQAQRTERWRAAIAQFESLRTRIVAILLDEWRKQLGTEAAVESYPEQQGTAATLAREQWHYAVIELTLPAAGEFLLTAVGRPELEIDVYISSQRHDSLEDVMRAGDLMEREIDTGWFSRLTLSNPLDTAATRYAYVLIDKANVDFRMQLHRQRR